jgi:glycosyltransferase involved in cell wall biosynthesis
VFVHRSHGFEPRVWSELSRWRSLQPQRPFLRRAASRAIAPLLEFNNRAITKLADGHIVSCGLCAAYLNERYGVPIERIGVVAQAAPALYHSTPPPMFDAQRLYRLLYVGQFAFFKAPMILAAAFEQILRERPQASLTWVCGASHHAAAAALLGPLARRRVTFVDWVGQRELMNIYDDHGVFLFPSFFEGFGKAFLEAMTRGLLVIASAEGGAKDLIVTGHNGILVPVGDSGAIARAFASVGHGELDARGMGEQARLTGLRHTWSGVAQHTIDFYTRLIELR